MLLSPPLLQRYKHGLKYQPLSLIPVNIIIVMRHGLKYQQLFLIPVNIIIVIRHGLKYQQLSLIPVNIIIVMRLGLYSNLVGCLSVDPVTQVFVCLECGFSYGHVGTVSSRNHNFS